MKRANVLTGVLLTVYCVMLRPILEYCHVIYHSMITKEQSSQLENMQRMAMKIIYGFDQKYSDILSTTGIKKLEERRTLAFQKFAVTISQSERYKEWFEKTDVTARMELRNVNLYKEKYARTQRLYNSPLYAMRRYLNERDRELLKTTENNIED